MGVKIVHRPAPLAPRLAGGIPETMRKAAAYLRSGADRRIRDGVPPANSPLTAALKRGSQTLKDSGDMARGIAPHSGALWADASSNAKQARLLQEGGTIRPKKARALWIPAGLKTRELMKERGAHTPGDLIRIMKADGYGWFYTPLSKVYCMYKKGKALKGGGTGKDGKPFALFIVRSSVTIPARPFLYIDGRDASYLFNLVVAGIKNALKGKGGAAP
jgi:phage gpG-like protein